MRPDLPGGLALNAVGAFGVLVRQADATRSRASSPIERLFLPIHPRLPQVDPRRSSRLKKTQNCASF